MTMVRIHRRLESDTLHLPELQPLIGKNVEIIVQEEIPTPSAESWKSSVRAAEMLRETGYDLDAWREQRDWDAEHADDHLP